MPVTLGVIGLGLGVGQTIWGAIEKKKAQKAIDANAAARPQYQINPEEYDMQSIAESNAGRGLSDPSRQLLTDNALASQAGTQNALLKSGASGNAISAAANRQQEGLNQIALYDDQARLKNLANLQGAYARMSANKDKAWQINKEEPWKDKQTALAGNLQGANNLFMGGINSATSGLMNFSKSLLGNNTQQNPMQMLTGAGGNMGGGGGNAYSGGGNSNWNFPQSGYNPPNYGSGMSGGYVTDQYFGGNPLAGTPGFM